MSDIYSILSSGYASAALSPATQVPYVAVDPASYQGSWTGTFSNNQKFDFQISNVNGFRAQVKFQSGPTVSYQQVLINNNSFRIGDTKFTLTGQGTAQARSVITSPIDGSTTLIVGDATQAT